MAGGEAVSGPAIGSTSDRTGLCDQGWSIRVSPLRARSFVTVSWSGPTKLTQVFRIERSVGAVTVAYVSQGRDAVDVPPFRPRM